MRNFFSCIKKSSDAPKVLAANNTDVDLLEAMQNLETDVNSRKKTSDTSKGGCCGGFFSCVKKASDSISPDYKRVILWLTQLANEMSIDQQLNKEVMISALRATTDFIVTDQTKNPVDAELLQASIQAITLRFNLDINADPDYEQLDEYCKEKGITIPEVIMNTINPPALNNVA